jgi:predicted nucleic acid-binding protein
MTALVFVDTNVLLYAHDARDPSKRQAAQDWLKHCWALRIGRVSTQVLNEFYNNCITKFDAQIGKQIARDAVRVLRSWQPPHLDEHTIDGAWSLQDRYALSYWDALILSSAQQQGCKLVLSEDMGHEQRYDSLMVINPFKTPPSNLNQLQPNDD